MEVHPLVLRICESFLPFKQKFSSQNKEAFRFDDKNSVDL
jgi:hypothetical protein